jgi:hypothetical protein
VLVSIAYVLVRITNVLVNKHMCEYIICVDECNRYVVEHSMCW